MVKSSNINQGRLRINEIKSQKQNQESEGLQPNDPTNCRLWKGVQDSPVAIP